ncbi:MAG TPA: c-type cytochrome [Gammaproteobacteria bacterium]|nr:c-type cytochrome [Gammaproteobacteria bacterium]
MVKKYCLSAAGGLLLVLAGIILWGGFNTAMEWTNTLSFCISCHEMESTVYQEYRHTVHYSNPSGVRATCPDCHVPRDWGPKVIRKIKASRELWYWATGAIDTREKFEARRLHLAERVWQTMKDTDSRECRNCHAFTTMDLAGQGRFAARIHGDAIGEGKTCIDCHKGISHHLPAMPAETAVAQQDIDMEYGEEINETCAGCHGEYAQGTPDGEYPRLAGLDARYIARQLRLFKSHERENIPMIPFATERELPEEDVRTIAAYLSSIELPTRLPPVQASGFDAFERLQASKRVVNIARYPGNIEAGGRLYAKECAACHGHDGYGDRRRAIPQLAGQRSRYLRRQIENFRKGKRLHDDPRDAEIFRSFPDSDIDNLLAWLSVQDDADDGKTDLTYLKEPPAAEE